MARHIVHHIPGNPTVIVQNQPAAGGMVMTNQLFSQGPKDGTVIGAPLNGVPTAPMLQAGAQLNSSKLSWIGSINREAYVGFVWHTAPVSQITDMARTEVLVGSTTVGATMNDFPLLLNDLFGYKFKVVRGYQGTPQINLAIERGEIQGNAGVGWASVKALTQNWIDEKKIKILVQYNPRALSRARRRADGDEPRQDRHRTARDAALVRAHRISRGRISCRPTCRPSGSRRCGARSTPP